jgi:hypothetical protein
MTGIYNRWDLLNVNIRQEDYEPLVPMEERTGKIADLKAKTD